jgi:regulator of replication initiation timing
MSDTPESVATLLEQCAPYLKDGETPAQRIERDHKETLMLMEEIIKLKTKISELTTDNNAERAKPLQGNVISEARNMALLKRNGAYGTRLNELVDENEALKARVASLQEQLDLIAPRYSVEDWARLEANQKKIHAIMDRLRSPGEQHE